MDVLSFKELFWLFCVYSFLGWVGETAFATVKHRQFINRGLINGPFCLIYGFAAVLLTVAVSVSELSEFQILLLSTVYTTAVEYISGHLVEKIWKERWWDYSDHKYNLGGYVCLQMSIVWGVLGYLVVRFGNQVLHTAYTLFPGWLTTIVLWAIAVALLIDAVADIILWHTKVGSVRYDRWQETNHIFMRLSGTIGSHIASGVEKRMTKAYPVAKESAVAAEEINTQVFAYGCSFYKIVLLFFIGAFLGDLTETIFCRLTAGVWMSRSSVVWGPFSIVWGLAIAAVTALLYKYKDAGDSFLFLLGTVLGGAYEYLCSVFTEIVFGKVFWDYSAIPYNIAGRINLLYCFFWGIATVVWFKKLYPVCAKWIEKIPMTVGKVTTWLLIVFMITNISVSAMALVRHGERENGCAANSVVDEWLDAHYDDAKMKQIYPNAINTD